MGWLGNLLIGEEAANVVNGVKGTPTGAARRAAGRISKSKGPKLQYQPELTRGDYISFEGFVVKARNYQK